MLASLVDIAVESLGEAFPEVLKDPQDVSYYQTFFAFLKISFSALMYENLVESLLIESF